MEVNGEGMDVRENGWMEVQGEWMDGSTERRDGRAVRRDTGTTKRDTVQGEAKTKECHCSVSLPLAVIQIYGRKIAACWCFILAACSY